MDSGPKKTRDAIETYNQAYQACGELWFTERTTPTVVVVCDRIRKKHTAVVGRAIKAWKEDVGFDDLLNQRRAAIRQPPKPLDAPAEPDFGQAVAELYRKAKAQAWQELEVRENELEQERLRLHEETAAAQAARETTLKEWAAYRIGTEREIETLRAHNAGMAQSRQEQGRVIERLMAERETLLGEVARREGEGAGLNRILEELKEAHQNEIRQWQERFDLDHDWYLQRIAEEKEAIRAGMQAQLDRLAARIHSLEPEVTRAAELRWESKLKNDDIARLRQANATLQRKLGRLEAAQARLMRDYRPVSAEAETEKNPARRCKRLPGFWRANRRESRFCR